MTTFVLDSASKKIQNKRIGYSDILTYGTLGE